MDGNSSTPCGSYTANPSFFGFNRQCDGSSVQIYQAFTECLPTVTIRLESFNTCPFSLIIVKENKVHQRVQIEPNQFFYASFDSVKEVRVQCSDSQEVLVVFRGYTSSRLCSCCQSSDESSDEC